MIGRVGECSVYNLCLNFAVKFDRVILLAFRRKVNTIRKAAYKYKSRFEFVMSVTIFLYIFFILSFLVSSREFEPVVLKSRY